MVQNYQEIQLLRLFLFFVHSFDYWILIVKLKLLLLNFNLISMKYHIYYCKVIFSDASFVNFLFCLISLSHFLVYVEIQRPFMVLANSPMFFDFDLIILIHPAWGG